MLRSLKCLLISACCLGALLGSDAVAVEMTSGPSVILEAVTGSATLLTASDVPIERSALQLTACNPNGPSGDCLVTVSDQCTARKLKASARYCEKMMLAARAELQGASKRAGRESFRARARFLRQWRSAERAAAKAGGSCSEASQDFASVADAIRVSSGSYTTLASSDLDMGSRPGRSCASGRIRRAAQLCEGLLGAEHRYYAAGSQNDPEMILLEAAENRALRRFGRNWNRLPRQCGDAELGEASESAVMSLVENTQAQLTSPDTDGDGTSDALDTDDDGDGVDDAADEFPLDPAEHADTDGDGTGDNADTDDDGDGWLDADETACETEPLNEDSTPTDTDNDGLCDVLDADADGNGATDDITEAWMTVDFPVGEVIEYDDMELSPVCSKGTPWSLFVRAGTVNKLLVYYQGGGACFNPLSCVLETFDTNVQTDPEAGGSDHPSRQTGGLANLDNPENPFRDWHTVFVPYCTGDVHWGDSEVEYEFGGTTQTIRHKGAVNAKVAESFIADHFTGPEQVFVTGSSAGAYGAVTHSVGLLELFPDAQFDVVGDGGNGVVTQDFLLNYLSTWGFEKHLPEEVPELNVPLGELDMSGVYEAIARRYPDGRFATYTTAFDGGGGSQIFFYHIMKNTDNSGAWGAWWESACEWNSIMRDLNQTTAAAVPNFRYYVGAGSAHTTWGREKIYTDTTGGVPPFVDWVKTMLYGEDEEWLNVECAECGQLLEGDPRPDPLVEPFSEAGISCPGTP